MKCFVIIAMQVAALAALAAGPPLRDFCIPFDGKNCTVVWEAPTNGIPGAVKIQKVTPTKFAPDTISNLLQMAELTQKNKKIPMQQGVFGGKDVLAFGDKDESRYVGFVPSQGFITFYKQGVVSEKREKPAAVPNDAEALNLALALLPSIGIRRSELATEADGKSLQLKYAKGSQIFKDKASGNAVTNVVDRTVFLNRQIDGIPIWGPAGITMKFGNGGKLAHLEVIWRAVVPDKDSPIPTASEFTSLINSGHTFIRNEWAGKLYKKLIIKKVRLYYWESDGSEPQSHLYPFAVLDAETDAQGEDSKIEVFVPFAN